MLPSGYNPLTGKFATSPVDAGTTRADASATANTLMTGGLILATIGAVNSAIGTYFAAESQTTQLKMQAQNQKFSAQIAAINARRAGFEAEQAMRAGAMEIGRYSMGAAYQKAASITSMAARGIQGGVGSAAEVLASQDLIKQIDMITMNANRFRQAEAIRSQRINYLNEATIAGTSANNLLATASTISPITAVSTSLMTNASSIASAWAHQYQYRDLIAAQARAGVIAKS